MRISAQIVFPRQSCFYFYGTYPVVFPLTRLAALLSSLGSPCVLFASVCACAFPHEAHSLEQNLRRSKSREERPPLRSARSASGTYSCYSCFCVTSCQFTHVRLILWRLVNAMFCIAFLCIWMFLWSKGSNNYHLLVKCWPNRLVRDVLMCDWLHLEIHLHDWRGVSLFVRKYQRLTLQETPAFCCLFSAAS